MQKFEESFNGKFEDQIKTYSKQNSNKQHKIVINVIDTQYAVIKYVAKKYKWNIIAQPMIHLNFDICWTDNHLKSQFFARMQEHQKINHIPGMAVLSRKNCLGKNLMLFRKRFPYDYDFFPATWNLPLEYSDLVEYHQNRQQGKAQTFIVKPQASCQGRGIFLTRNIDKLKNQRCVVQRYMHKPYLIENLKFDLRIYVLITGIDPLRIFVYDQGLARFATQQYRAPRTQNLDNKFMHLTNYAINKDSQKFIFNESISDMNIGHKRSLKSVYKLFEQQGYNINQLKQKINDIFIKTIITGYPTLSRGILSIHPDNFANDMCFQILGFDIMVDYKLNPILLEVNYTPSFTADTPLDCFIKKKLIQDTIQLININQKWKQQMKRKRQKDIQQRMVTGKRKKYTLQQRKQYMQQYIKKRNQYQQKHLNDKNGYTKIFLLSKQQMKSYQQYYQYAQQLYIQENGGVLNSTLAQYCYFYKFYYQEHPFKAKQNNRIIENQSTMHSSNNRKNMGSSVIKQSKQNYLQENNDMKNKRVSSAKIKNNKTSRRYPVYDVSSSKLIPKPQSQEHVKIISNDQFLKNQSIFKNKGLQDALLKKKSQTLILYSQDQSKQAYQLIKNH